MSDILTETPNISSIIANEQVSIFRERKSGPNPLKIEWDHPSFARTRQLMEVVSPQLREKYPGQDLLVDLALDLYFGPYRLDERFVYDSYDQSDKPKDEKQKLHSARIGHAMVHAISRASQVDCSRKFTDEIYKIAQNFENITSILQLGGQEHGVPQMWWAVKSELAIARALGDLSYEVILPDYEVDIEKASTDNQLKWDTEYRTDLVAGKLRGEVLLVDCKGRLRYEKGDLYGREGIRKEADVLIQPVDVGSLPKSLQDTIKKFGTPNVKRAKIIVPTVGEALGKFRWDKVSTNERRKELQNFSKLNPIFAEQMVQQLNLNGQARSRAITFGPRF